MLKIKNKVLYYKGTITIIIVAFLLYELLTDVLGILDSFLFPGFTKIWPSLYASLPKLFESMISSSKLLIPGYFGAAVCGITLGIIIGTNPKLNKNMKPIIFGLNPIPPSTLTPYLIAIMPTFYYSSVAVIFIGCFWPFLNGTINGIVLIDQKYLDNSKVLELEGFKKLFNVLLPAAAPSILAGAGTALNLSFILLITAEMFATNSGFGYFIQYNADFSDYAKVISGLLFMGAFIVIIMLSYEKLKKKILFWTLNENK